MQLPEFSRDAFLLFYYVGELGCFPIKSLGPVTSPLLELQEEKLGGKFLGWICSQWPPSPIDKKKER